MKHIVLFFVFILLQVFLFDQLTLFDIAYCQVFFLYALYLPLDLTLMSVYGITAAMGLIIGLMSPPIGAHASAALVVAAVRLYWISAITPQLTVKTGSGNKLMLDLEEQPVSWQFTYVAPLVFLYQVLFQLLVDFNFTVRTFLKILASGLLSTLFMLPLIVLIYRKLNKKI
jgi:hypothetical protein